MDTICTVPPTVAHQPRAGCIRLVLLYPCMFCVALSMDLFVLCVAMFVCVCYFVVECVGVVECGPSERLDAPSISFVCVFVCRKLSPHLGV